MASSTTSPAVPSAAAVARAQAEGLGAHRATYGAARAKPVLIVGLVFMFLISAVFLVGFYFLYLLLQTPNLNRKNAAKRMHLFEYGLVLEDSTGPVRSFRWESLTVLQEITQRYVNGIYVGTVYQYTLTGPDGSTTKLTGKYDKVEEWGPAIQSALTRTQMPAALAALESGQDGRFGDLVVNRAGITSGKKAITWAEIEDIKINQGVLFLKKSGKWASWSRTPVKTIPNFFLFLALANHMVRATARG